MRQVTTKKKAAAPAPKERVKGAVVTPDYLLRLMDYEGPTAAAKSIGTTPSTLHKARNMNLVTRSLEVAAQGVWHMKGYAEIEQAQTAPPEPRTPHLDDALVKPTAEGVTLMLVQVPDRNAAMLLKTAEMLSASVVVQD
jgi:hypothetical protein